MTVVLGLSLCHTCQVIRFRRISVRGKCNFSKYGRITNPVRVNGFYTTPKIIRQTTKRSECLSSRRRKCRKLELSTSGKQFLSMRMCADVNAHSFQWSFQNGFESFSCLCPVEKSKTGGFRRPKKEWEHPECEKGRYAGLIKATLEGLTSHTSVPRCVLQQKSIT